MFFRKKKRKASSNDVQDLNLSDQDKMVIESIRDHFDPSFYALRNPDVQQAGIDPLIHYTLYGWREERDPNPEFSTRFYLNDHPDVAAAGVNPFWHYIVAGKAEGRVWGAPPEPMLETEGAPIDQSLTGKQIAHEVATIRSDFDSGFYMRHNPDVANAGVNPVEHFVMSGWKEGRDPNPSFSIAYYLEANPDIREAKINPFWHYIVAGRAEGRLARHPGGYRAETLTHTRPLEETVKAWCSRKPPEALLTAAHINARVHDAAAGNAVALMLSIGHDNYRDVPGGVQFCIQHEEEIARDRGIIYLNMHPHQPLPRLANVAEAPDVLVSLLLAGEMIGTAPMSAVTEAVAKMAGDFDTIDVVVHHLLGHSPEQVAALVHAAGKKHCFLWLHDFLTLCPSFALQRNNVSFCGAPPLGSNACALCLYGQERAQHQARIKAFFDGLDVHVIAPAEFTARYWRQRTDLRTASLTAVDHMALDWTPRQVLSEGANSDGGDPITIAFIGYPVPYKGWPVFLRLVREHRGAESKFRFIYFGTNEIETDQVERFPVSVSTADPDAMIRAIAEQKVDFVLHWATWAETFSFSTYEALAGGAYVLTNSISGNVAATVGRLGRGAVLNDEADLDAFFRDGRLTELTAELRAKRLSEVLLHTRSDLTFKVLDMEAEQ